VINYFNNKDITILETIIKNYHNRGISKELLSNYKREMIHDKVYYIKHFFKKIKKQALLRKQRTFHNINFSVPYAC
jgi:hypothetical protein